MLSRRTSRSMVNGAKGGDESIRPGPRYRSHRGKQGGVSLAERHRQGALNGVSVISRVVWIHKQRSAEFSSSACEVRQHQHSWILGVLRCKVFLGDQIHSVTQSATSPTCAAFRKPINESCGKFRFRYRRPVSIGEPTTRPAGGLHPCTEYFDVGLHALAGQRAICIRDLRISDPAAIIPESLKELLIPMDGALSPCSDLRVLGQARSLSARADPRIAQSAARQQNSSGVDRYR